MIYLSCFIDYFIFMSLNSADGQASVVGVDLWSGLDILKLTNLTEKTHQSRLTF